ncbi:MAG: VCBS repeat-containing protein [Planctomycetes bacterium]|nr:VCBS repeat-containing protein [Planctomycetota bacterium]
MTACASWILASASFAQLTVVATDPLLNASHQSASKSIAIDFDRAVASASLSSFGVYGHTSGTIAGSFALENGGLRVRFTPAEPFFAGELIDVVLDENLQAQDGSFLRTQGYTLNFRVATASAPMSFTPLATWDVDPTQFARIYGGQTADLNDDDFSDLAIICENSSDVRVFMSNHDGTGSFGPLFQGTAYPVGNTPSPNENADFDGDGFIDIVTCESVGNSVSVLLGNGDGTFQAATTYSVLAPSHGLAVLDVDGDGDIDIAASGNDEVQVRVNAGNGTFPTLLSVSTSVQTDYALAAADMNNDGVTDLVVGSTTGEVVVLLSNGDGTFVEQAVQSAGGHGWMLQLGDLNGDRKIDASVANGGNAHGSILLGNGDGTLQAPMSSSNVGHMPATDLGDLDGDGDLDWVLSSFGAGVYQIWRNDGAANFSLAQTIPAVSNPACAALFDIDGDRDLDIALLDELGDVITIMENGAQDQQTFCYGTSTACPCGNAGDGGHGCDNSNSTGGALLLPQGLADVGSDSLVLNVTGLPTNTTLVFMQSASQAGGGLGLPFGDGLLCVGSPIKRLATKAGNGGAQSFGSGIGSDPKISIAGLIPPAGGTFYYQVWYRNNASFCTAATSNLSNGVRIVWTP